MKLKSVFGLLPVLVVYVNSLGVGICGRGASPWRWPPCPLGARPFIAWAGTWRNGKMLQKIGADKIIYSEKEMGVRVAHNLISPGIVDYIEMENNITILSIHVPEDWIGKSILDIDIR